MKYNLHYAKLDLQEEDIPCAEFSSRIKRIEMITNIVCNNKGNIVFVLCFTSGDTEQYQDIFVSHNCSNFNPILYSNFGKYKNIYLQEYESYEEAYKIALSMQETDPRCYEK